MSADEPFKNDPVGRFYQADDGYYVVEKDGSIWELDFGGYRVDRLPESAAQMVPVPAGARAELADVVHGLISETGTKCAESESHQPLCFHIAYGVAAAGWRPVPSP